MKLDNLVSIIVPVYNTQDYLNNCINSILNQTYKNIEIILIDDGSTDRSAEICDQYAMIDDRVRVIHQKNSGVSNARNNGLEQSKGDYIAFVDSDDTIDKDFIEVLYNGFYESIDMTVCAFDVVKDQNGWDINNSIYKAEEKKVLSREEAIETVLYGKLFAGHSWNKMFRKKVLSNIKFHDNIYVFEDMLFVVEYLLKCNHVLYIEKPLYRYYIRDNSASHGTMSDKKMTAFNSLDIIDKRIENAYGKKFLPLVNYDRIQWIMYCYNILTYDKAGRKKYGYLLKEKLSIYISKSFIPKKMRFKIRLLKINTHMYYFAVRISNAIREILKKQ